MTATKKEEVKIKCEGSARASSVISLDRSRSQAVVVARTCADEKERKSSKKQTETNRCKRER